MVDQATMNSSRAQAPIEGMRRNMKGFAADLVELTELQLQLLSADFRESQRGITVSTMAIVAGAILALGCVPVALAALALVLMTVTGVSAAVASLIALLTGLIVALGLLWFGWSELRRSVGHFRRTRDEVVRNFRWLKKTLRHSR